jgi:hypothetical protein
MLWHRLRNSSQLMTKRKNFSCSYCFRKLRWHFSRELSIICYQSRHYALHISILVGRHERGIRKGQTGFAECLHVTQSSPRKRGIYLCTSVALKFSRRGK